MSIIDQTMNSALTGIRRVNRYSKEAHELAELTGHAKHLTKHRPNQGAMAAANDGPLANDNGNEANDNTKETWLERVEAKVTGRDRSR